MMFLTPGTRLSCCWPGVARRTEAPQVMSTSVAPRALTCASMSEPIWSFSGQAGVVRSIFRATRAAVDVDLLDHVQAHDVAMQLRVLDVPKGVGDGGVVEHVDILPIQSGLTGIRRSVRATVRRMTVAGTLDESRRRCCSTSRRHGRALAMMVAVRAGLAP